MTNINYELIDTTAPAPEQEPERQRYFIAKCREIIKERELEIGRNGEFSEIISVLLLCRYWLCFGVGSVLGKRALFRPWQPSKDQPNPCEVANVARYRRLQGSLCRFGRKAWHPWHLALKTCRSLC